MSSLLLLHVTAGVTGLLVGPVALVARKQRGRWHGSFGRLYQASVAVLTATTVGLVLAAPTELWWLGVIGAATQVAAATGWWVQHRRRPGWLPRHVRLMCGSYISSVTAAPVVNWSSPLAWVLPTLVGTPAIELAVRRVSRHRPRPTRRPRPQTVPAVVP
ncbi:MAG: hypothetical protein WD794_05810 [Mycobacteriales bacterium]